MVQVREVIDRYRLAVEQSSSAPSTDPMQSILSMLMARDALARAIKEEGLSDPAWLIEIVALDRKMKESFGLLGTTVNAETFESMRQARLPENDLWWWGLLKKSESGRSIFKILLSALPWLAVAISLGLLVEFLRRLLSGGGDLLTAVIQGFLAVLVGGTLVEYARRIVGQKNGGQAHQRSGMNWSLSGVAILGAVIWAAILVSMQPRIAHFYVEKGNQARSNGSLTQAIQHYQRAISINPDDHKAHYELASAYEDVRELDKSIIEYQTAILLNDQNSLAYNNLARLYILQKKDFTSAIELLDKAITNVKPTNLLPAYRFAFYKNRGWAYMCLERYSQARDDLKFALTIQEKSSVAHYLLGKIAEAQKQRKTAVQHWEECRKLISTDSEQLKDMEADWTAYIRERLDDGGER